jgi:hypothetical protein
MAHSSAATPRRAPDAGAILEWVLIGAGWALLFALPHSIVGDDNPRFQSLTTLIEEGRIQSPRYALIGPLLAAPFYLAGKAFGSPVAGVLAYDPVLFALMLAALYLLLRRHWPGPGPRRFLLLLVAGSMFPRHLLHFGAEAFTATFVAVGLALVGVAATEVAAWSGWGLAILGAVNTPATLAGVGLASLQRCWEERRWRILLVPVAALAVYALDLYLRVGSLHNSGYTGTAGARSALPYSGLPDWSYPVFFGLLSLTLSFGKGLAFFADGLCLLPWLSRLALPDRIRAVLRLWLAFLLAILLVYSHWWGWYGGFGAGPRFMLFAALPASLLLAQLLVNPPDHWLGSLGALVLVALACWSSIAATVFEKGGEAVCTANNYGLESFCWYTPEFSVLWNPFVGVEHAWDNPSPSAWAIVLYGVVAFLVLTREIVVRLVGQIRAALIAAEPTKRWGF